MKINISITGRGPAQRVRLFVSDEDFDSYMNGDPCRHLNLRQKNALLLLKLDRQPTKAYSLEGRGFVPSNRASQKVKDSFDRMLFLGVQAEICIAVYGLAVCRTEKLSPKNVDIQLQEHFLFSHSDIFSCHYEYLRSVIHRLAVPSCRTSWTLVRFFTLHYLNNPSTRPKFEFIQSWAPSEVLGFSLALVLREDGAEEKFFGLFLGKYKKIVSDFIYQEIIGRKTPPSELEEKIKLAFDIKNLLPTKKLEVDDFL